MPQSPPLLEHVKQMTFSDIQNSKTLPSWNKNLSAEEYKSINSLFRNQDIVIKPADKGSGIVILNRDNYIKKVSINWVMLLSTRAWTLILQKNMLDKRGC